LFSKRIISFGVPAGAKNPCHEFKSYPASPASAMVGIVGAPVDLFAELTPKAVSLPY
jgi:hypothetical protein